MYSKPGVSHCVKEIDFTLGLILIGLFIITSQDLVFTPKGWVHINASTNLTVTETKPVQIAKQQGWWGHYKTVNFEQPLVKLHARKLI